MGVSHMDAREKWRGVASCRLCGFMQFPMGLVRAWGAVHRGNEGKGNEGKGNEGKGNEGKGGDG